MTAPTPPQPPAPPLSLVAPVTFQTAVSDGTGGDGTRFVMLRVETATGSTVLAMPTHVARQLGEQLVAKADEKPAQGLVIPTPNLRSV